VRELVIPATYLGLAKDPWGQERIGFEAELTLNRKDFGLNWNATLETGGLLVGDNVHIALSIQAVASQL
jgi:polyisoprenoid-binding protein YceI